MYVGHPVYHMIAQGSSNAARTRSLVMTLLYQNYINNDLVMTTKLE